MLLKTLCTIISSTETDQIGHVQGHSSERRHDLPPHNADDSLSLSSLCVVNYLAASDTTVDSTVRPP
jgi:hypothetical protein